MSNRRIILIINNSNTIFTRPNKPLHLNKYKNEYPSCPVTSLPNPSKTIKSVPFYLFVQPTKINLDSLILAFEDKTQRPPHGTITVPAGFTNKKILKLNKNTTVVVSQVKQYQANKKKSYIGDDDINLNVNVNMNEDVGERDDFDKKRWSQKNSVYFGIQSNKDNEDPLFQMRNLIRNKQTTFQQDSNQLKLQFEGNEDRSSNKIFSGISCHRMCLQLLSQIQRQYSLNSKQLNIFNTFLTALRDLSTQINNTSWQQIPAAQLIPNMNKICSYFVKTNKSTSLFEQFNHSLYHITYKLFKQLLYQLSRWMYQNKITHLQIQQRP